MIVIKCRYSIFPCVYSKKNIETSFFKAERETATTAKEVYTIQVLPTCLTTLHYTILLKKNIVVLYHRTMTNYVTVKKFMFFYIFPKFPLTFAQNAVNIFKNPLRIFLKFTENFGITKIFSFFTCRLPRILLNSNCTLRPKVWDFVEVSILSLAEVLIREHF